LGKGNLFLRDYGKHVYTFALRPSGKGIRISLKPGIFPSEEILKSRPDEVFKIKEVKVPLPEKAEIADSVECASCGEYVMSTKAIKVNERFLCIPCHQK
jgi:formylmethanofuran dehydrogenase subunit E